MSLRDGTKKMSKSDPSDLSRINITDDADTIAEKDPEGQDRPRSRCPSDEKGFEGRPEAENLVGIYAALTGKTVSAGSWRIRRPAVLELQEGPGRSRHRNHGPHRRRSQTPLC